MNDIDKIGGPVPWDRHEWTGSLVSFDGTAIDDFERADVAEVVACTSTKGSSWDTKSVAVVRLADGRFVAWETWWAYSGDGFCHDAYGGDTDIIFASMAEKAVASLSDQARDLLAEASA